MDPRVRILPGGHPVDVVGESFYAAALDAVSSGVDGQTQIWADLVAEDDNPYDPNAVRVEIDGQQVGHLSREFAPVFRPDALRLREMGLIGRCAATINGNARRKIFGIVLDLAAPEKILKELDEEGPDAGAEGSVGRTRGRPDPWARRPCDRAARIHAHEETGSDA